MFIETPDLIQALERMAAAFMPTSSNALTPPIPTESGFGTKTQATR